MHTLIQGTQLVHFSRQGNATQLVQYINDTIVVSPAQLRELSAQYDPSKYKSTRYATASWWAGSALFGDAEMSCAAQRTARWAVKSNEKIPVADRADVFCISFSASC